MKTNFNCRFYNAIMFSLLSIFTLLLLVSKSTFAALYGDKCYRDAECQNLYTHCEIVSPTCGAGTCVCVPGFVLDSAQCKIRRHYGESCDPAGADNVCSGLDNVECSADGRCVCSEGYHYGPAAVDKYGCIPETMNVTRGGKCYDNIQCLFGLGCRNNVCSCHPWQKEDGPFACSARELGDQCESDGDCGSIQNSFCGPRGVCACSSSAKFYKYLDEAGSIKSVCAVPPPSLSTNTTRNLLGAENQDCNVWPTRGQLFPCRLPYLCTFCRNGKTVCARVSAVSATSITSASLNFVTSTLVLQFALLFLPILNLQQ